jgi:hypothetical protein
MGSLSRESRLHGHSKPKNSPDKLSSYEKRLRGRVKSDQEHNLRNKMYSKMPRNESNNLHNVGKNRGSKTPNGVRSPARTYSGTGLFSKH